MNSLKPSNTRYMLKNPLGLTDGLDGDVPWSRMAPKSLKLAHFIE